jgi:hypothetical protein
MRSFRRAGAIAVLLALAWAVQPAFAGGRGHWHGHGHGSRLSLGLHIGLPLAVYPYAYPHYAPMRVIVQQQPTIYIEQPQPQQSHAAGYWYYCADARAYYPYVRECPAGWQRVAPQPGN